MFPFHRFLFTLWIIAIDLVFYHSCWNPPMSELEKGVGGLTLDDVSVDTIVISSRYVFDKGPVTEPIVPPICHSSTYKFKNVDQFLEVIEKGGYIYSRFGTFTSDSVECAINTLERGAGTLLFNTGMSSITTALFGLLKSGDHVLLYGETPCNPNMAVLDLEEFGKLGRSLNNVITMVDSTFASSYNTQPIKYGIDISMHSCGKYLGGHSDLTAGSLTFRTKEMWQKLSSYRGIFGSVVSAHDASLLLRGIKTLALRMERHNSNGLNIAEYLEKHHKVVRVAYPGLASHPQHEVAKKQMRGFSGMMSFEVKGGVEGGKILAENVRLIQLAVSLGGVESLIEHPATMTHGPLVMSDKERKSTGLMDCCESVLE